MRFRFRLALLLGLPYSDFQLRYGHKCVKIYSSFTRILMKRNIFLAKRTTDGKSDDPGELIPANALLQPCQLLPGVLDFGEAALSSLLFSGGQEALELSKPVLDKNNLGNGLRSSDP